MTVVQVAHTAGVWPVGATIAHPPLELAARFRDPVLPRLDDGRVDALAAGGPIELAEPCCHRSPVTS